MDAALASLLADFDADSALEAAKTIPGSWYVDPRIAGLERERVFGRTWQLFARASQLESPGSYVTGEVAGEPVVVVRGRDGVLRGFFNVCRHHAAAVCTRDEGRAESLRCPYHGWVYDLDGRFRSAPDMKGLVAFDPTQQGLVPLSVSTWESFVFVHVGENPEPLEHHLGGLVARTGPLGLSQLRFFCRKEWTIACNWKVFVDNYLDGGYHVPLLHKGLASILSHEGYTIECFDRVCLQSSPVDTSGGEAMTAAVRAGQAQYYWLYPNLMINWYEGYLDTNLVIPLSDGRMKVIFDFYFADVSEEARPKNVASVAISERIQDEDHAICESVQRGLGSRAYRAGRLSARREAGERLFHQLLARDLRR